MSLYCYQDLLCKHIARLHHGRCEGESCVESLVLKAPGCLVLVAIDMQYAMSGMKHAITSWHVLQNKQRIADDGC